MKLNYCQQTTEILLLPPSVWSKLQDAPLPTQHPAWKWEAVKSTFLQPLGQYIKTYILRLEKETKLTPLSFCPRALNSSVPLTTSCKRIPSRMRQSGSQTLKHI